MALHSKSINRTAAAQWLILAVVLICLGVVISFNLYVEYKRTETYERDRLSTQARVIAANIEHQLVSADRALSGLLIDMADWKPSPKNDTQSAYLRLLTGAIPGVRSIAVLDREGVITASDAPAHIGSNLRTHEHFQSVRRQPDSQTLYVSPPHRNANGHYVITLSRMVPGPRGEFGGMVSATLDPEYFRTLMASVLYAPDMWDAIAHGDGLLFMMMPERDGMAGKNLVAPDSLFVRHRDSGQPASVFSGKTYATSELRMMALETILPEELKMDKPLVAAASRDLATVFRPWWREAMIQMGLYVLLSMISVFGLFAYWRRHREFDRKTATAEAALRASEENYRMIVENSTDLIIKIDTEGRYTYVNPAFCALYGLPAESLLGRHYSEDVVEEDREMVDEFIGKLFHPPYTVNFSERENTVKGIRHLEWMGKAIFDEKGAIKEFVGVARDVTDRMNLMDELEKQAQRDYLTGLANRRRFMAQSESELSRAQRYGHHLSLFMIDIDHFKKINDTYGHKTGDIVLQALSRILEDTLRTVDIIGRIGGEEFAVLLPETDMQEAAEVAERLRQEVAMAEVSLEAGLPVRFTVSIGIASLQENTINVDTLLSRADEALYRAKNSGRNRVCHTEPDPIPRGIEST